MSRTRGLRIMFSTSSSTITLPWLKTVTFLAIMRMNCMSCSTTMSALLRFISRTRSAVFSTSSCVMPAAGSSSRINSGSVESTIPSSTHCRWPCASWPTRRSAAAVRPIRSSISSTRALAFSPRRRRLAASQMFSRTERPSNTFGTCVLMPMPSRAISWGWALEMSCPRNSTWPWVGSSWPVSILKKVLLPAPFGPIRQRNSPSSSVKLTLRTARTPPKCMLRSRVCSSGSAIALLRRGRFEALFRAPAAQTQQRQPPIAERRHQSLRHQQHERDQDQPKDQGRVGEDLRPPVRTAARLIGAERGVEPLDADAADDRTDQRAAAADQDPDDDLRRLREPEDGRADEIAPIGEQTAGKTGERAADRKGRKLVGARIVAQKLGAPFVLADADDDTAEPAREQKPQSEIGDEQRGGRQIEHAFEIDHRRLVAGKIERWNARDAVEPAEPRRADMEFRTGGGVDGVEQDQRHSQGDDAEIDVADAPIEHEIAEQCCERRRQDDGQQDRDGALAEIEHGDRVGVGAKSEERRLAEAENAAIAPDQRQAERQHRHHHVDGEFEHGIELGDARRQDHEGDADDTDHDQAEKVERASVHRPLRKKRPVIPCGSRRIRTIAAASKATSPNTGVVTKVAIWLMAPNSADADIVPLRMAAPPPITVIKDFAT